jgi:hypothetical protein
MKEIEKRNLHYRLETPIGTKRDSPGVMSGDTFSLSW